MKSDQRQRRICRPELDRAQQNPEVVRARPQLGRDEDDVGAVIRIAMPAGPQTLAESFSPYPRMDLEYERLVELVRWHAASIAARLQIALDALGSISLGGEPHTERDESNAAEAVECALDARPAEHVTAAGRQLRIHEQPEDAHAVEEQTEQEEVLRLRVLRVDELGEEAREEDGDLRVEEVAREPLTKGAPARRGRRRLGGAEQRAQAEVNEVERADQLDRRERHGRGRDHRRQAERCRQRPDEDPEV